LACLPTDVRKSAALTVVVLALGLAPAPAAAQADAAPADAAPADAAPADAQADAAPAPADPASATPLTTEVWTEPAPPLDLGWTLLSLPEHVVELSFQPLAMLVGVVERYRLDKRAFELFSFLGGRITILPDLSLQAGDGFGAGLDMSVNGLFLPGDAQLDVGFGIRGNGDTEFAAEYQQTFAFLEGRRITLLFEREIDQNLRYYGIGNDTDEADRTNLRDEYFLGQIGVELTPLGATNFTAQLEAGFWRQELSIPSNADMPELPEGVGPPPGFEDALNFPRVRLVARYDTRDNLGRPTRGLLLQKDLRFTQVLGEDDLSSIGGTFSARKVLSLLPDKRVIELRGGFGWSVPLDGNDVVPFQELVEFGRSTVLRGYDRSRFRDEFGWWTGVEYHFPIFEYLDSGAALEPKLFFEIGRVSGSVDGLFSGPLRPSYGIGLRGAQDVLVALDITLGFSPEGFQFDLSAGVDF